MSYFSRKMVLYSFNKFGIFRSWTNIQWLWKFDLGFWQTSKLVYRKLKNSEKVFWRFQSLHPFPRKMVLYLWTKFCIFESCTNIQSLRRFELSFWQIAKQIHRKLQNRWRCGLVDITEPELKFCTCSNPARSMSETHDGEDLWQWSWLEIIIIIIIISIIKTNVFQNSITQRIQVRFEFSDFKTNLKLQYEEKLWLALLPKKMELCISRANFAFLSFVLIFGYQKDSI